MYYIERFSHGTLVSSTNKTDHHHITEILFTVALNTINLYYIETCNQLIPAIFSLKLNVSFMFCLFLLQQIWYIFVHVLQNCNNLRCILAIHSSLLKSWFFFLHILSPSQEYFSIFIMSMDTRTILSIEYTVVLLLYMAPPTKGHPFYKGQISDVLRYKQNMIETIFFLSANDVSYFKTNIGWGVFIKVTWVVLSINFCIIVASVSCVSPTSYKSVSRTFNIFRCTITSLFTGLKFENCSWISYIIPFKIRRYQIPF